MGILLGVLSIVNETVLFIMVMKQPLIVSFPEGAFQKLNINIFIQYYKRLSFLTFAKAQY